jgi:hypothetical protein
MSTMPNGEEWPELPYEAWRDTRWTLHLYLQIIGKVRLALAPMEPEWAQVPLYVTARGLNTSPIPHANGVFDIDVDLIDHVVAVRTAGGDIERVALEPRTVAAFHAEMINALRRAGVPTQISTAPQEVPFDTPFDRDTEHRSYEPEWATRYWRALVAVDRILKEHRAGFRGKVSPVHLFWGSLDLAVTRFSGRLLEPPRDAGLLARYGGDAEQSCVGFWPGHERIPEPAFFAYTSPAPNGYEDGPIGPEQAAWSTTLGEFLLPYEAVRTAPDPRGTLLEFARSAYRAGADRAGWSPELQFHPER